MVENELDIVGNILLRSRNGDRRWIDVKLFTYDAPFADAELLKLLIGHPHFRDGYVGVDVSTHIHGPYELSTITTASYSPIESAAAIGMLDSFCARDRGQSEILIPDINSVVRTRIATADAHFRLQENAGARHEHAYILWEFDELLLIRRQVKELALVVMGLD